MGILGSRQQRPSEEAVSVLCRLTMELLLNSTPENKLNQIPETASRLMHWPW